MFADKRAATIGDILTVIVDENATMVTTQQTKVNKQSSINNAVNQFLFTPGASNFGTHNGELPATDITGDNTYTGGGEISNRRSFSTRIPVAVVDLLPNGNLVVEGSRALTFSGESHYLVLRGIVRKSDISSANTVLSSDIADSQVNFISQGSITKAQKKGWLLRLNDMINPF